ncbi:NACHT domain-containing protein [Bacillus atrophaeus]|uniref:NACHT domain-containing protein n=1 Tax=Bacillus atrophaeus TaxID=1452 RepID=UPI001C637DC1|nr:hypothetical protein [Bacillus atrophaeus]QYG87497.1 hypothetical protein HCU65_02725 [Bacillus atrophaeus]
MEQTQFDTSKFISDIVQKNMETILKGIVKFGKDKVADIQVNTQYAYKTYLTRAAKKYGEVKTLIHRTNPINLYEFYVYTNLECEKDIISAKDINDLLRYNRCNMVLGSGGTGKSTLFKHLFLSSLMTTDKIPVFVPLRNVNGTDYSLIDCIYEELVTLGFTLEKDYFIDSLDKGVYIFLFDGFDEVEDSRQTKMIREIDKLTCKYNENYYLVSSRLSDSVSMGWDGFSELTMLPLTKEKSIELIRKLPYDNEIKDEFIKKLKETLYDDHESFCNNPLLLTLMLMTFDEFADIPQKIHVFFGQAFDVLNLKHDAIKPYKRPKKTDSDNLGSDGFTKILETISALSYLQNKVSFNSSELNDYIVKAKKIERLDFNTEDYKSDLIQAVCILVLDGLKYIYLHRSFQEYFTAKFINRQSEDRQKKMLMKILSSGRVIRSEQVLNILFDQNRAMVEKLLIIPLLKEFREEITGLNIEEIFEYYIEKNFERVKFHINAYNGHFGLLPRLYVRRHKSSIVSLLSFVDSVYFRSELPAHAVRKISFDSIEKLDSYLSLIGISDDLKKNVLVQISTKNHAAFSINSARLISTLRSMDSYLKHNIIKSFNNIILMLENNLNILKKIEKEHQEMELVADDLFDF